MRRAYVHATCWIVLLSIVCPAQVKQTTANLGVANIFTQLNQFTIGAQFGPVSFVVLNAMVEIDGVQIFCQDCQQTTPCVSGGTGAMATGIAGAWSCASGGSGGANVHLSNLQAPVALNQDLLCASPVAGYGACNFGSSTDVAAAAYLQALDFYGDNGGIWWGPTIGNPLDTSITRLGPASLAVGNNTVGDYTGSWTLTTICLTPSHCISNAWPLRCETGLGDGLNVIPAATYRQTMCYNDSGVTWTITGIKCYVDAGSGSTLQVQDNSNNYETLNGGLHYFTCTNTFASGTQNGTQWTTGIPNGGWAKFTFVADGTATQTTWVISMTQ